MGQAFTRTGKAKEILTKCSGPKKNRSGQIGKKTSRAVRMEKRGTGNDSSLWSLDTTVQKLPRGGLYDGGGSTYSFLKREKRVRLVTHGMGFKLGKGGPDNLLTDSTCRFSKGKKGAY